MTNRHSLLIMYVLCAERDRELRLFHLNTFIIFSKVFLELYMPLVYVIESVSQVIYTKWVI
jgi:hypothetical protein